MAKKGKGTEERCPEDGAYALRGDSIIEFHANRSVVVEGCRCILEYSDTLIRISTRRMNLKFEGRNLEIICMSTDAIAIEGFILCLSFEI